MPLTDRQVIVIDEDYPDMKPVHCQVDWKAGVGPPLATQHQCENETTRVWFPEYTFYGVRNFQLQFAQTTIDARSCSLLPLLMLLLTNNSIGECPQYCYLTKYASVNITYPGTPDWSCDPETAVCQQDLNTTIKAPVYLAVA